VEPDRRLVELGTAIADGKAIDWGSVESSVGNSDRDTINQLQLLERIARVHGGTTPGHLLTGESASSVSGPAGDAADTPSVWGPLTIVERLGRGTYGDVYLARDPRLDRPVALKLLRRRERNGASVESAVVEEGRLMARVRHPNVATVHGAERIDGRVGLWMEFIEGRTLQDELRDRGPFPSDEVIAVGRDLASALAAVHDAGLLHRDLKAQNVLRDRGGRVVLTDFGAGREVSEDAEEQHGHELAGTPLYLAPELLAGGRASAASDVYSLGVLLYHLATGSFPVRGRSLRDLSEAHARGDQISMREERADLPRALATVIERALQPDPARRYQSAAELESALAAVVGLRRTRRNLLVAAGLAIVLTAAAGTAWKVARPVDSPDAGGAIGAEVNPQQEPEPQSLTFNARDWVLIVPFENRTGEAVLDGTLESALEHELANSAFVNVAPRDRIDDVLQLMQKPASTTLDARLGREIALRDGDIRLLIAGRIEKVGTAYVTTSQLIDPADGAVLRSLSDEAPAQSELLRVVRRQALRVRETLGEMLSTIRASESALEHVSTPSLHALQLYSRASAFMHGEFEEWRDDSAEQLLRQAIDEDPQFASAHILLAYAIANQSRPREEFMPYAARAAELARRASDVERYFILGSYHDMASGPENLPPSGEEARAQLVQAVAAYEALMRIKPDHYHGLPNLVNAYRRLERQDEAAKWAVRTADVRRSSFRLNYSAAAQLFATGDVERARVFARRARALVSPAVASRRPLVAAQFENLTTILAWLDRDVETVRQSADAMAKPLGALGEGDQAVKFARQRLLFIYVGLGRFHDARDALQRFPPDDGRGAPFDKASLTGRLLFEGAWLGDQEAYQSLRDSTMAALAANRPVNPEVLALLDRVDALRAALEQPGATNTLFIQGQLALAEDRIEDGARLFQSADEAERALILPIRRLLQRGRARVLARAWEARGDLQEAARVLADATEGRWAECVSDFDGVAFWIYARDKLADLNRRMGRTGDADAIDAELVKLLARADADHPVRLRLESRARQAADLRGGPASGVPTSPTSVATTSRSRGRSRR
jgi:serine/threonine-protein kinase